MNLRFFIDRPVFSGVISVVIVLMGAIAISRHRAPDHKRVGFLSGSKRRNGTKGCDSPVGGSYQRRGGYDLYDLYRLEYR